MKICIYLKYNITDHKLLTSRVSYVKARTSEVDTAAWVEQVFVARFKIHSFIYSQCPMLFNFINVNL